MSTGEDEIRVQLVRIEGKQDVTNERLSNVQNDIADIRHVQRDHASDIQLLKTDKSMRDGQRQGVSLSSRILWAIASLFIGTGLGAALLEAVR